MPILSAFLFAISTNLDCLALGLSYGVRKIHIDKKSNLIIALIASFSTYLSMLLGSILSDITNIQETKYIGSFLLLILGGWIISEPFFKRDHPLKYYDKDHSGSIDIKESLTLSLALSINNIGVGVGASISGLNLFYTTFFTFLLSLLFIQLSQYISQRYISQHITKCASLLSGTLLFVLALTQFL